MATIALEGETIRATGGHPFWVVRGDDLALRPHPEKIPAYEKDGRQEGRWVLARDLRAGDEVLLRFDQVVALESVGLDRVEETVYNFHVAEQQNYAVGLCGVLVHNTSQPGVGGNGAASELPNLTGKSPADAVKSIEGAGFTPKSPQPSAGGWQTFKHPDGSQVDIHFPSGRVVRTAPPRYGTDGSRTNRGNDLALTGPRFHAISPMISTPETLGGN